jgi:hypothetical protein
VVLWVGLGLGLLAVLAGRGLLRLAGVGAAYHAKTLCSAVFVSGRAPEAVLAEDLAAEGLEAMAWFRARVEREAGVVRSSLAGLVEREAVYRPGLGCALVLGGVRPPGPPTTWAPRPSSDPRWPWPEGDGPCPEPPTPGVDDDRLRAVMDSALKEIDPVRPRRTRALVVAQRGRLLAERYAPGFGPETALAGWSMSKSVLAALVGVLVGEGRLALEGPVPVPAWGSAGDPRRAITLRDLLRMSSGLGFEEVYTNPLADVTWMLFGEPDTAGYAAARPLAHPPGTAWSYSSGTSNILSGVLRAMVGEEAQLAFPRRALFDRLGMGSAVLETDPSGTFVGSSFMLASARDWARFGELLRLEGVWRGERVLPEGWVGFMRSPAPAAAAQGRGYGGHLWLEIPAEFRGPDPGPELPGDAFHLIGHQGQFVSVIPSRGLVVVRLGLSGLPRAWDHQAFLAELLAALPR